MKPLYSKAQLGYIKAHSLFDQQSAVLKQKIEHIRKTEEITQDRMEELVQETGFHHAHMRLLQAENELIHWARSIGKADQRTVEPSGIAHLTPAMRAQAIERAMKVRA